MRDLSSTRAAIVLIVLATVLIFGGAAIRVRSDRSPQLSTPDSAEAVEGVAPSATAISPAWTAVTTPPVEREGNGIAGAVVGFGLLAVWLIAGLAVVVRSRVGRQQSVGTLE